MQPRILLVQTYYPEFLREWYQSDPTRAELPYQQQQRQLLDTGFAQGDAYSHGLKQCGCEANEVIINADPLQDRWAKEHDLSFGGNIHDRRRQILAAQIRQFKPDVLYVFEWCPLGDEFLAEIKPLTGLIAGQIASPLHPDRSYKAYDLMISSWPPLVEHFRKKGRDAAEVRLAFDERVLDLLKTLPLKYDVTFVGGFAPSHPNRVPWLERLMQDVDVTVFGYGLDNVPENSQIQRRHRGPVWGWRMYQVLRQSRITLNLHARIDIRGSVTTNLANNMRLYEATGVGTCLLTELKDNLHELFEPQREVITYANDGDCVEKIGYYLKNDANRVAVAKAGQTRALQDHTYSVRMGELLDVLQSRIQNRVLDRSTAR